MDDNENNFFDDMTSDFDRDKSSSDRYSQENQKNSNSSSYNYGRQQNENIQVHHRYDDFMYEPIGFESLEKQYEAEQLQKQTHSRKKESRVSSILLALLLIIALIISIIGLSTDIANSKKAINKIVNNRQIILYRDTKPENANDIVNLVDENGKFTVEGAAAHVKPSIVEIYTFADAAHSVLIGTGSGVVISDDGYIVTNAHVLQSDGYHTITTVDDKTFNAKIIGRDAKTDIAVIKADSDDLIPATLGNSDEAIVGETVIAIGNPARLSSTVTDGIISALNRSITADSTGFEMNCIQTNADISPGNSGGALVNLYGQVIGITSSKYISDSSEGLGFAITINEVIPIIEELVDKGYIGGRFKIGISLLATQDARDTIEEELGFELPDNFDGIFVVEITDDSDLLNTELKIGDFITEINGKSVKSYREFNDTISGMYTAGDTVPATCAHVEEDGTITYYKIKFKLLEDTSGNY